MRCHSWIYFHILLNAHELKIHNTHPSSVDSLSKIRKETCLIRLVDYTQTVPSAILLKLSKWHYHPHIFKLENNVSMERQKNRNFRLGLFLGDTDQAPLEKLQRLNQ